MAYGNLSHRKRRRYAELLDLSKNRLDAYNLVEFHQGAIID